MQQDDALSPGEHAAAGPFPDDVLSHLLRRLVRSGGLLEPHVHDAVRASLSEVLALGELAGQGQLTQAELGERLALEKSTVSRLVAGMEHRGWLRRDRDPDNRRYLRLSLTADGAEVADRIGAHLRERHREVLDALTAAELQALAVGLTALARAIDASPATRRPPRAATPAAGAAEV